MSRDFTKDSGSKLRRASFVVAILALLPWARALADSEEPVGHIDVSCMTDGVRLSIDGIEVSRLPLREPLAVSPGSYTVTLSAPGYMAHTETVMVEPGRVSRVEADLFAFAGVLYLLANVEGASVRIGRLELGRTPLVEREIVAGEHEIFIEAEGFLPGVQSLRVLAGERYDLTVTLVPDPAAAPPVAEASKGAPSIFGRWWVWAAAGAVLAGGSVALLSTAGRTMEIYDPARLPGGSPDAIINPRR